MNAASNQATTVLSYNAGGNAVGDGGHNFTYDADDLTPISVRFGV